MTYDSIMHQMNTGSEAGQLEQVAPTIVYEVIDTNLKVRDGEFLNELFFSKEVAYQRCLEYVKSKQGQDIQEDPSGELEAYSRRSAGVYYTSYYGSYPCVCFVKTRQIN